MTRILVVDDDRGILNVIRKALEKEGYQTDTLDDPEKLDFRRLNDYQLILLDVMMPGTDGFSLCRRIRDQVDCPILFVTAKTDEADLMTGLGIGGDDYITKPFGLGELRARVAAHLRRENRERKHVITLGELSFSLNSRQVFFQGAEIPFTKSEYAICEYLALFSLILLARPHISTETASRFKSHSQGPTAVSSKSLMSNTSRAEGERKIPKLPICASPTHCTGIPVTGVVARSLVMMSTVPR